MFRPNPSNVISNYGWEIGLPSEPPEDDLIEWDSDLYCPECRGAYDKILKSNERDEYDIDELKIGSNLKFDFDSGSYKCPVCEEYFLRCEVEEI